MSELIKIFTAMEAYHLLAAQEAAKAKKLLEGEAKGSPAQQRGLAMAAKAVAERNANLLKAKNDH